MVFAVNGPNGVAKTPDPELAEPAYEGRSLKTPSPLLSVPVVMLYGLPVLAEN